MKPLSLVLFCLSGLAGCELAGQQQKQARPDPSPTQEYSQPIARSLDISRWAVAQQQTMWCWAACAEVVANTMAGAHIVDQQRIVERYYGQTVDQGGLPDVAFNRMGFTWDWQGVRYNVLLQQLNGNSAVSMAAWHVSQGRPSILLIGNGTHAVVMYGYWGMTDLSGSTRVDGVHIFDPLGGRYYNLWGSEYLQWQAIPVAYVPAFQSTNE